LYAADLEPAVLVLVVRIQGDVKPEQSSGVGRRLTGYQKIGIRDTEIPECLKKPGHNAARNFKIDHHDISATYHKVTYEG